MEKIAVAGATGYLGRYMVRALKEHGFWIRALVRNPNVLNRPGAHGAPPIGSCIDEVFHGEVTRPDTIKGICEGMDRVFSSVGITRQKDGLSYMDVDYQGNMNLLREAEASGTARFMYVAVFKGNEMRGALNACKERFVERLKQSALASVIVRPTGYYSDMGEFLKMAVKGRAVLIGDGMKRMNPIHGADLADFCVEEWFRERQENIQLSVGGPQVLSHREMAGLAFRAAGKPEKITRIPAWLFKSAIAPLKWIRPQSYGPVEFLYNALTHDLIAPCYGSRDLLSHFEQSVGRTVRI